MRLALYAHILPEVRAIFFKIFAHAIKITFYNIPQNKIVKIIFTTYSTRWQKYINLRTQ
jgi:hypothetical protein